MTSTDKSLASPTISAVMAVHNGQAYLAEAVESVLGQTLGDLELIIVDDGSTDRTAAIIDRFAASDARISVIRQQNCGLTRALNVGLSSARGRYIARIDADDVAEPPRFAQQARYLDEHPDCLAVGCKLLLIDPDGEPLSYRQPPLAHDAIVARLLEGVGAIPHPSAMIRHEAMRSVGGYRETFPYAQDLDLWLRLAELGELANLDQPLLRYRLHYDSATTAKREQQLECARQAVEQAYARRKQHASEVLVTDLTSDRSTSRTFRSWARMALRSGNRIAARKHSWNAFRAAPCSMSNIGILADWLVSLFAVLPGTARNRRSGLTSRARELTV